MMHKGSQNPVSCQAKTAKSRPMVQSAKNLKQKERCHTAIFGRFLKKCDEMMAV